MNTLKRLAFNQALTLRRRRFLRQLECAPAVQERLRRQVLRQTAATAYGRSLGLLGTESYEEFVLRVPAVDYDMLAPWITRQAATKEPVVTTEPIGLYEETSGSSGVSKLVPYPPSLLRALNDYLLLWTADLIANGPTFGTGRMFLSLSPACRALGATPSGVPIGVTNDTEYFTPRVRRFLGPRLVAPPGITNVRDPYTFRRLLASSLVAASDLEIISVWSPTYLLSLLQFIEDHRDTLHDDLVRGRVRLGAGTVPMPACSPGRLALLRRSTIEWSRLWPRLKLLSAWADGTSRPFAMKVREKFPDVLFQPKGLLATEGPMTLPMCRSAGPIPLPHLMFYEVAADDGTTRRLHELAPGDEGNLIVSRPGLLRYQTHDRVGVVGHYHGVPCLEFRGRSNQVSDLVGEKLNEACVAGVLARVLGSQRCALLLPDPGPPSGYHCLIERRRGEEMPAALATRVDSALRRVMQYDQARLLGQLAPIEVHIVPDLRERYERVLSLRGLKWGDIKFSALLPQPRIGELEVLLQGTGSSASRGGSDGRQIRVLHVDR